MKKHFRIFTVLVILSVLAYPLRGAIWMGIDRPTYSPPDVDLIYSDGIRTIVEFRIHGFMMDSISIDGQTCVKVSLPEATPIMKKGFPELPKLAQSVIIPDDAHVTSTILEADYTVMKISPIAPSKGHLTRDVDPDTIPYVFSDFYKSSAWYPEENAWLSEPFILRDFRGITLYFNPFRYNPAEGELQICKRLRVEVKPDGVGKVNVKRRPRRDEGLDHDFYYIYENLFINFGSFRYTPIPEPGRLLIITYDGFYDATLPLFEWKRQKGIPVELVRYPSETGGGSSAVKNYIQSEYDSPEGLTYIILVGDVGQIPTLYGSYENAPSDPCYVKLEGSDNRPDAFISRISATSNAQVEYQVAKFLDYDKEPDTGEEAAWYHKGTGIASDESGGTGMTDWQRCELLREDLLNYTYTEVDQIYDPGATATQVTNALNDGRSIINYIGHGSGTSWGTTGFSNSDIDGLSNGWMLPFIIDVACLNGNFTMGGDCFAERWLKSGNVDNPRGAIGMFGSSTLASWVPPCVMQAEAIDLLVGDLRNTFGGMCFNGILKAMDEYPGTEGVKLMEQYNLFGDCCLMIRTDSPQEMVVIHQPFIYLFSASYDVTVTGLEDALCSLYGNGIFYGSAYTDSTGNATIELIESLESPGEITLTVTAYNKVPYITQIPAIPPEGPYVVYQRHLIDDSQGNGDGQVNPGESVGLSVWIENLGVQTASNVIGKLNSEDPYVSITDSIQSYGNIAPGDSAISLEDYNFSVNSSCPDGHSLSFSLICSDDSSNEWTSQFQIVVGTPVVVYEDRLIDDWSGNSNGWIEPGETADLIVTLENVGSVPIDSVEGTLSTYSQYIEIIDGYGDFGSIPSGGNATNIGDPFVLSALPSTPYGHPVSFQLQIAGRGGYQTTLEFGLSVGKGGNFLVWVPCPDSSSGVEIRDALEEKGYYGYYTYSTNLSEYRDFLPNFDCVFISLGIYPNNYVLQENADIAALCDYLDSGGKVYMEGGDTWYFDSEVSLHSYFGFDGIADGSGDAGPIQGKPGVFTDQMYFEYGGANNYMDHLGNLDPSAFVIFENVDPPYDNGVAYDPGTYRTIGTSFLLGGLVDGVPPCTKSNLVDSIMHFFNIYSNYPPALFSLLSPSDHDTVNLPLLLDWETSEDPDPGDTVRYKLLVSTSAQFKPDSTFTIDSLMESEYLLESLPYPYPTNIRESDKMVLGKMFHSKEKESAEGDIARTQAELNYWRVLAYDNRGAQRWSTQTFTFILTPSTFVRGDCDGDYEVATEDATSILRYNFIPGTPPPSCMDAADADDNGAVEMPDAIFILKYKFIPGSPPPPAPFPDCGPDPTLDELNCQSHPCMGLREDIPSVRESTRKVE